DGAGLRRPSRCGHRMPTWLRPRVPSRHAGVCHPHRRYVMHKLPLAAIPLALAPLAYAQQAHPLTRAEVKAETRALEKAGKLTPAGEGSPTSWETNFKSTKTREERKTETTLAAKNGEL